MNQATLFPMTTAAEAGVMYVRDAYGGYRVAADEEVRGAALLALAKAVRRGPIFDAPAVLKDYLKLRLAGLEYEVFMVLFVDAQHQLIVEEEMFRGTLMQTSVYPREVVKAALAHNAAAVVLVHNHPSGVPEPSRADECLTQALRAALQLVDVRVLDHFVVGRATAVSFAERGLL